MNSPYLLIPIALLLLLLYLSSGILVRLNILSKTLYRKIWNSALLITFLATGILGVLLAIQTNYKLEWPLVKTMLQFHVDFGIAMVFVAAFHFFRHSRYYLKIFRLTEPDLTSESFAEVSATNKYGHLNLLILLSGFLSTTIQVLLIRELTTVFQGNELMMSWTLGAWMLLTGAGAFMGRSAWNAKKSEGILYKALPLLTLLPVVMVPLLEILKMTLFPPGIMVNPAYFLLILVIALAPVCLLSGFIYSLLVNLYRSKENGFSEVYALEAVGSMSGGLIVSFVFILGLSVIQSFLILLLLVTMLFAFLRRKTKYFIALALSLAAVLLSGTLGLDNKLKSFLFVNQKILESEETGYGNLDVTENSGQYNFYGNGSLLYTTDNTITREEYTHYAMMQRNNTKDVLLVSGGVAGMVSEILKYKTVLNIDYVELNPRLIGMAARYVPLLSDKRVHLIYGDGRRVIQHAARKYDAVILAVPDPSSLQINRYYTDEFISLLKQKLNPGAVVLYALSSSGNYLSAGKTAIETVVFQTLKKNFLFTEIIPGERDYFIASDSYLRTDFARLSASRGIDTKYVNSNYMDDLSIQQRGKLIRENLKEKIINKDEKPLPVYFHTLQFISQYTSNWWMLILIPVIILLLPLLLVRSVASGMYISGFTASSFEILIIFTFQTYFGYVYLAIGLIIAVFMGGLAIGSILGNRYSATRKQFGAAQILLGIYSLLFPVFWILLKGMQNTFAGLLILGLITIVLSAITGFQYVIGTKLLPGNFTRTAPLLYAVDLIGAALGTIVLSILLLPLLGVVNSCFFMAGLNILIALVISIKNN
jgi:spermidine synthase